MDWMIECMKTVSGCLKDLFVLDWVMLHQVQTPQDAYKVFFIFHAAAKTDCDKSKL